MLGTTFGGNHLACAAGIAVLEIIRDEQLIPAAAVHGAWLMGELATLPKVTAVRGRGLMIGIDFPFPAAKVSKTLREQHHILVGSANDPKTMRLLPPLSIRRDELMQLVEALRHTLTVPDPVAV
jgi:acetylornithine aminotransferase